MTGLPIQPKWRLEAESQLRKHAVDVEKYPSKVFRFKFFMTVGHIYWERLIASTERQRLDDIELADRLGLSAATVSRWTSGVHPPAADKFFAVVLLVLKKDLKELELGSQNDLLFDSIQRQHEELAAEYCEPPSCTLDRFVFQSLLRIMHIPAVDDPAPNAKVTKAQQKAALEQVVVGLNKAIQRNFDAEVRASPSFAGSVRKVRPQEVDEWLASWGVPYTLFAMGCTRTWGIEDV